MWLACFEILDTGFRQKKKQRREPFRSRQVKTRAYFRNARSPNFFLPPSLLRSDGAEREYIRQYSLVVNNELDVFPKCLKLGSHSVNKNLMYRWSRSINHTTSRKNFRAVGERGGGPVGNAAGQYFDCSARPNPEPLSIFFFFFIFIVTLYIQSRSTRFQMAI